MIEIETDSYDTLRPNPAKAFALLTTASGVSRVTLSPMP
jgi:hypothetical protein